MTQESTMAAYLNAQRAPAPMTQPDRYDAVRRREHSTLGDAMARHRRDTDAFTAGAQYALDQLLGRTRGAYARYNAEHAADILGDVHEGTL